MGLVSEEAVEAYLDRTLPSGKTWTPDRLSALKILLVDVVTDPPAGNIMLGTLAGLALRQPPLRGA